MAIRLTIAQNRMKSWFALTSPLESRTLESFTIMEPRGNACAPLATISKYPFGMFFPDVELPPAASTQFTFYLFKRMVLASLGKTK